MATLVLHIGTHKTASTTIQDMFAHNAGLLCAQGLIYPRLGRASGHHGLARDWVHLPPFYALDGGSRAALARLDAGLSRGDHTVMLSSEEFSRGEAGNRVDLQEMRALLSGFERIRVISFLREQAQFLQSIYLELSKTRLPPALPELIESALETGMAAGLWLDYRLLHEHLLTVFAPGEITYLDYDDSRCAPGGVIGAMLAALGTGVPPGSLRLVNGGRSNPSPPALPTWAAHELAAPQRPAPWLLEAATGAFGVEYGAEARSCLFTRAEWRALSACFEPANADFAARLAATQPGFRISRSLADEGLVFRDALTSSFWLRCGRWTYASAQRARKTA